MTATRLKKILNSASFVALALSTSTAFAAIAPDAPQADLIQRTFTAKILQNMWSGGYGVYSRAKGKVVYGFKLNADRTAYENYCQVTLTGDDGQSESYACSHDFYQTWGEEPNPAAPSTPFMTPDGAWTQEDLGSIVMTGSDAQRFASTMLGRDVAIDKITIDHVDSSIVEAAGIRSAAAVATLAPAVGGTALAGLATAMVLDAVTCVDPDYSITAPIDSTYRLIATFNKTTPECSR